MEIELATRVVASKAQVSADLADEVVILSVHNGEYYGLDGVGARVWSLIQTPATVAEVRDGILREYDDVDRERCTTDVLSLLQQLADESLVEVVGAQADA